MINFISHPIHGIVEIKKTLPKQSTYRYNLLDLFCSKLNINPFCLRCGKLLINPQSRLIHLGTTCKNKP